LRRRSQRLEARTVAELDARGVLARRRIEVARQAECGMARMRASAIQSCGRRRIVATGTEGSAATDTNEEFAPFSSRRRTR
jgi:hypothetical protein